MQGIYEIVDMAGGMTQGAVPESINMAGYVPDGQMIYIPVNRIYHQAVYTGWKQYRDTECKLININTAGELMTSGIESQELRI